MVISKPIGKKYTSTMYFLTYRIKQGIEVEKN